MRGFKILKSSVFTSIQDNGRFGYNYIGVTNSGASDEYAYNYSNKLLSNDYGTNSLEILWGGLKLKSYVNTYFVVTGANFHITLNKKIINNWESYKISYGDILEFHKKSSGQIAYFTVKDGFDLEKELGSVSSCIKDEIGGIDGNLFIKKDDFLITKDHEYFEKRILSKRYIPKYENNLILRVIESYQNDAFLSEEKNKFYNNTYTVTKDFNKMACKLSGEPIKCTISDIISEGISFGSIQIPKNGQAIILLKERQTIGGYPKFGCVCAIDCFKLSQMPVGSKVKFIKIDLKEAQNNLKQFYSYFKN